MDSGAGVGAVAGWKRDPYDDHCRLMELMHSHKISGTCNDELLEVFHSLISNEELVLFMEVVVGMVRRVSHAEISDKEHYRRVISIIRDVNLSFRSARTSVTGVAKDLQNIDKELGRLNSINILLDVTTFRLYYVSLKCWCKPLCNLVLDQCGDIIFRRIELPSIEHALEKFLIEFHKYCESKWGRDVYEKDRDILGILSASSLTLKLATKCIDKESVDFLRDILKAHWLHLDGLIALLVHLRNISKAVIKADRRQEASQLLEVCLPAVWDRVLLFCSEGGRYSQKQIANLIKITCITSASWLIILSIHDSKEIKRILSDYLKKWSVAKISCDKVPHPEGLIEAWVLIQCKQDPGNLDSDLMSLTIYSLMSTYAEMSKEVLDILIKQELQVYRLQRSQNKKLCNDMLRVLIKLLYEEIYSTNDSLERSKNLIESAQQFRACGVEFLDDCKNSICEAINIMSNLQRESKGRGPVCHILAGAYCLRALCSQELKSYSQEFVQDIENAIELWSNQEGSQSEKHLWLLYSILDMLSVKGYMKYHSDVYEGLIQCFKSKNLAVEDWLTILWKSRSLSHGLCVSPIDDTFVSAISNHTESSNCMQFWTSCMQKFEPQAVGFQQNFTVPSTLSSPESYSHDYTTQRIKDTASKLLDKDPLSKTSLFVVAYMYYDLAEILSAKGSMVEALSYAKEALNLRTRLLNEAFVWSHKRVGAIIGDNGEVIEGMRCVDTLRIRSAVATEVWPNDKNLVYSEGCLTPWKLLECYLESSLQMGNLTEDAVDAECALVTGKDMSSLQGLPIFSISFSSALGKLYRKQRKWKLAEMEVERAKTIFTATENQISCVRCRTLLKVSIDAEIADMCIEPSKSGNGSGGVLQKAERLYIEAEEMLKGSEWKNEVSAPQGISESLPIFCDSISNTASDVGTRGCESNCWHYQPSRVMNSLSLKNSILMKWECARRRVLIRLLIGRGNCLAIRGDIQKEYKVLSSSISMLVSRSIFWASDSLISPTVLTALIEKRLIGDSFRIEQASILYNTCCFSLKCISRNVTSGVSTISKATIVSGLKFIFIINREVPLLHQKVSRLLAILYTTDKTLCTLSALSVNQWAAFFHQASIGTYFRKDDESISEKGSSLFRSHDPVEHLEAYVLQFFSDLPSVAILCISILRVDDSDTMLSDLLPYSPTEAWIMLSRLNSNNLPIVIILPIGTTFITETDSSSQFIKESYPWLDSTVINKVAPLFISIIQERQRLGQNPSEWSTKMTTIDQQLCKLLSDIEEKWFGRWKLLWGEWPDYMKLDCKLQNHLKSKYQIDTDINILKIVLEGAGQGTPKEEFLSELVWSNGCYVRDGNNVTIDKNQFGSLQKTVQKTRVKMEGSSTCRKPIILIPDTDIQMLPWESLPILRCQEVYRMPSVKSIFSTLNRRCPNKDKGPMAFPTIDPWDAFYMLTPQDDLPLLKENFEVWFNKLNLVGTTGMSVPTMDEITMILQKHDLFIYIGHGSGLDVIPDPKIRELNRCAVVILMGCCSGCLYLYGSYPPYGRVLDYISGGSPATFCNLWNLTQKDAAQLCKTLLKSWFYSKDEANIGSSMRNARNSCYYPYAHGAAFVCYGVPTGIRKKDIRKRDR